MFLRANSPLKSIAIFALIFVLSLSLVHTSHAQGKEPVGQCESWLTRVTAPIVKKIKRSWFSYRAQLHYMGPIRLLLAPRREGARFAGWYLVMDPLIDGPTEVISYVSSRALNRPFKQRLSLPVTMPLGLVTWSLIFGHLDAATLQQSVQGLEKSLQEDTFGAAYTSEWILSGSMSAQEGATFLDANKRAFLNSLRPLHDRITEFVSLNLWSPAQAEIARQTLNRLVIAHPASEIIKESVLRQAILSDVSFAAMAKGLLPPQQFTIELLSDPTVNWQGHSDAYWLTQFFDPAREALLSAEQKKGMASLRRLQQFHAQAFSLATLAKMTAETLGDEEAIATKREQAQALGLAAEQDFIYRADLPLFSTETEVFELKGQRQLRSELDRWSILLKDPRFADVAEIWSRGEISDLSALVQTEVRLRALSQINHTYQISGEQLKVNDVCRLIYGEGKTPANPFFAGLQKLAVDLPQTRAILIPAIQQALAQQYYITFVRSESAKDVESFRALFKAGMNERKTLLTDLLRAKEGELPILPACPISTQTD